MSIEGMWCFVSGEVDSDDIAGGGVLILDTQRIYGGDGGMAHVGTYKVDAGRVTGTVESFQYNTQFDGTEDVFNEPVGPVRHTDFDVSLNENGMLVGDMFRGEKKVVVVLKKVRDLP